MDDHVEQPLYVLFPNHLSQQANEIKIVLVTHSSLRRFAHHFRHLALHAQIKNLRSVRDQPFIYHLLV